MNRFKINLICYQLFKKHCSHNSGYVIGHKLIDQYIQEKYEQIEDHISNLQSHIQQLIYIMNNR